MRSFHKVSLYVAILALILVSACANPPNATETRPPSSASTSAPATKEEPAAAPTVDFAGDLADFDSAVFDDSTNIDNEWFPLRPGLQNVFEGSTEEGGKTIPHQIVFTVTDLTKEIYGIRTVVIWVQDFSDGVLVEAELAFFAQDVDGNVWHMGEYPETYENGNLAEVSSWISGFKGAKPGISMWANPQIGLPSYSQGWGPAVNWTDRGQVAEMGLEFCMPADCYEDVLLIEEFSKEEPDAFQLKYFAKGVGNVRVGWSGADATRETLELVEHNQLSPEEMETVRAAALLLEESAYENGKEVYDQTPRSE